METKKNTTDYSKTIMYKLVCNNLEIKDLYIGHTTDFRRRKICHKTCCNNQNDKHYNVYVYQFIRNNMGWDNWSMIEIEKYPCSDLLEASKRERELIVGLQATLNKVIPTRTDKEYREQNADKLKEQKKIYYEQNVNKIKKTGKIYYEQNTDKIKEQTKEYYEKNADKYKEYRKEHYKQNADKIKETVKIYYEKNADKIKEYQKEYREQNPDKIKEQTKEYYEKNADKIKEYRKEYYEQNKEQICAKRREKYLKKKLLKTN